MRYALISDIHANSQAWKAVYQDIQANTVDRIICLGDMIGYGPNPSEVLHDLRDKVDAFVLGNHDAAVCGKLEDDLFNDDARRLLEWTRKQLSKDDIAFLSTLPLTLIGDGFLCTHGDFSEPGNFDYVSTAEEAMPSWKATEAGLLFAGHTHEPALFVLGTSGTPRGVEPQDFAADPARRYFVNAGSVGQPRTRDLFASYCIYDSEIRSVYWRRVTFDVEGYRKALKSTGLTLDPSYYLPVPVRAAEPTPVTKRIVFTPPKGPDKAAHNVIASQDMKTLPPRKKKLSINVITAILVGVILSGVFVWRKLPHTSEIMGAGTAVLTDTGNVLDIPQRTVAPGAPIPKWNIRMEDKYRQSVGVNLDPFRNPFYYMRSRNTDKEIHMTSAPIAVQAGQAWSLESSFQKRDSYKGKFTLTVIALRKGAKGLERTQKLLEKQPGAVGVDGLAKVTETLTIPDGTTAMTVEMRNSATGMILIRQLSLKRLSAGVPATPAAPAGTTPPSTNASAPATAPTDPWAMPPKQ